MQVDPRCTKHDDGTVCCGGTCKKPTELAKLRIDEVSLVGDPSNYHSRVVLMKAYNDDEHEPAPEGDEAQKGKEENTVESTIKKFIQLENTLREAEQSGGNIQKMNISKADAESALDELAQSLQARDGGSAESNFAKAMQEYPMLGSLALGMTTDK